MYRGFYRWASDNKARNLSAVSPGPGRRFGKCEGQRFDCVSRRNFRDLKYMLGLVNLHGKRGSFAEQEIWVLLTMFNNRTGDSCQTADEGRLCLPRQL